tara:strand:- start:19 stop:375 length:357 start_codon:yes stop_codon:yes gene_type:complete
LDDRRLQLRSKKIEFRENFSSALEDEANPSQLCPGAGIYHLATCANPDCSNFGQEWPGSDQRKKSWSKKRPDFTPEHMEVAAKRGSGAYILSGANKKRRRVSCAFEYEGAPHAPFPSP